MWLDELSVDGWRDSEMENGLYMGIREGDVHVAGWSRVQVKYLNTAVCKHPSA
jgi:hypothetical protein